MYYSLMQGTGPQGPVSFCGTLCGLSHCQALTYTPTTTNFAGLRFMKSRYLFLLLCMGCSSWVQAEIYKSVDAEGHVTYSNTPSRGAKKLGLEPLAPPSRSTHEPASRPSRARANASPSDFPRVDSSTQRSRDSTRRKILADELATEEKLLADARVNLKQGESSHSDGKLHAQQEEVTLHEKNVSALKTELANLK